MEPDHGRAATSGAHPSSPPGYAAPVVARSGDPRGAGGSDGCPQADPGLARLPAAHRGRPARPGQRRGLAPYGRPQTAYGHRRPCRQVGLPLLRGRLRTAGVRQGRHGRADRGRPRLARQPGAAVPQGLGHAPAHHGPCPPSRGPPPTPVRHRVGAARSGDGHGHGRGQGGRDPAPHLGVGVRRAAHRADDGHREPRGRHPRQRGELPHQEAADRSRRRAGGEPGARLPQLHRRGARHFVRPWRRHHLHAGPPALRLHRHPGIQLRRGPSGGFPVGDGGEGARGEDHPCRPAVHPHECAGGPARADSRGQRHRLPRRHHQPRAQRGEGLPRVRPRVHQRGHAGQRGLPGHRGPGRRLLRPGRGGPPLRPRELAVRGRRGTGPGGRPRPAVRGTRRRARGRPADRRGRADRRRTARAAPGPVRPRPGTRRWSTRGACTRSSSATTPATRPNWSRRRAASRGRPSWRCARH